MTRARMLREMPVEEFLYWQAMWLLEPFGDEWRAWCQVSASVLNAAGGKKNGGVFMPEEIMNWNMPGRMVESSEEDVAGKLTLQLGAPRKAST